MVSSMRSFDHPGAEAPELSVGISVHTSQDEVEAVVALNGSVCPSTADRVADAIERVAAEGATRISVDLSAVDICTSHGFDVFDRVHQALQVDGGRVELAGAHGGVARCLATLREQDPSFLRTGPGGSD